MVQYAHSTTYTPAIANNAAHTPVGQILARRRKECHFPQVNGARMVVHKPSCERVGTARILRWLMVRYASTASYC